jgi:hypothetical protein
VVGSHLNPESKYMANTYCEMCLGNFSYTMTVKAVFLNEFRSSSHAKHGFCSGDVRDSSLHVLPPPHFKCTVLPPCTVVFCLALL